MSLSNIRPVGLLFLLALASGCAGPESEAPEPPAEPTTGKASAPDVVPLRIDRDAIADAVAADLEHASDDEVADPEALLGDLFDESSQAARGPKVKSELLTNKDGVTLKERLDGVEVTVEVPTR